MIEKEKGDGNLPVLSTKGRTVAEAWEKSVVEFVSTFFPGQSIEDEHEVAEVFIGGGILFKAGGRRVHQGR